MVDYVLNAYQKLIAQKALDTFITCWEKRYTFRSDYEWSQCFEEFPNTPVNFLECRQFATDYGLLRALRWKKPLSNETVISNAGFLNALNKVATSTNPDPIVLANNWVEGGIFNSRQVSAASKFLFFLCPEKRMAIYDSRASTALRIRFASEVTTRKTHQNFTTTSDAFQTYIQGTFTVLEQHRDVWLKSASEYHRRHPYLTIDFFLRRITDKHLYLEGAILLACKDKNDTMNVELQVNKKVSKS